MGFQDRRYDPPEYGGGSGAFRRALRRIFVEGDSPLTWAFPLFTVAGIRVRIHLIFVLWVVLELIMSLPQGTTGVGFRAIFWGCLFVIVLLHEFGHCIACRWVGGEANDILMWPLGGLASCSPPHNWKAHLITTAGGPMVNVLLIPVLAGLMLVAGARVDQLVFNPFDPSRMLSVLGWGSWDKIGVFYAYYVNVILLLFNLVVPMFPMDGARMIQELLWRKLGWRRSMVIAVNVGLVTAVAIGLFSIATPDTQRLFGLALFGGAFCYFERQRLQVMGDEASYDVGRPGEFGYRPGTAAVSEREAAGARRAFEAAAKKQREQQAEQAEVDRILAKIAETGMGSLSRAERRVLERATDRRRKGGAAGAAD